MQHTDSCLCSGSVADDRNKGQLAQRYGLTERRVEQIASEQRAVYMRPIQPELFGATIASQSTRDEHR